MTGTKAGARKATRTTKARYGKNFFKINRPERRQHYIY